MTVLYSPLINGSEIEIGDVVVINGPYHKKPYKVIISRKTKNFSFGKVKVKDEMETCGYREVEYKFPKIWWSSSFQSYPKSLWNTTEYKAYRKKENQENESG